MGSKGSNTTTTTQNQTYAPTGQAAIQAALTQGQNAAQLPFNIPQAPVAGFSPDQLTAFQTVNNAQGVANPYFQQAAQDFTPAGTQAFLNPYASNVMAGLQNTFGEQQAQTTGQLTQAAGGVGADRIAVGQSDLANQQALAAGQTLSGLYTGAAQQAQAAGYGSAATGSGLENSMLTGAQAQLGTGGLQQQLSQAQLNSPYQLALAQAAFPYQQAQFNAGITGALAPALGGTTYGTGTTTTPQPSLLSQILGLGTAAVGVAGQSGSFSPTSATNPKGSSPSYGGGNIFSGDAYGGSASNPLAGLSAADYGARGGSFGSPYARGGKAFASGGTPAATTVYGLPSGFNDNPINVDADAIIPQSQLPQAQTHQPSLNLNAPAPASNNGAAQAVGDAVKIATMFMKKGGKVKNPYAFADGGTPDDTVWNPDEPFRMPDPAAVDQWRRDADTAMAFAPTGSGASSPQPAPVASAAPAASALPVAPAPTNAYAPAPSAGASTSDPDDTESFGKSPWLALTAAGLGIAGGTSPFALTNIAQGAMAGVKTLEQQREAGQKDKTVEQAAQRLAQEAKFHQDQYTKMTPYQQGELDARARAEGLAEQKPVTLGQDALGHPILGIKDPDKPGHYLDPITHQPVQSGEISPAPQYNVPGAPNTPPVAPGSADDAAIPPNARFAQLKPGIDTPEGTHPEVLAALPPSLAATVRAIDEGRQSLGSVGYKDRTAIAKLVNQYDDNFDQTTYALRNRTNSDLSSNGNAGKMILAVNQLLPHLKTASDKAAELDNSSYPAANSVANWWATATGDPRVKTFEEVREVAAMDAARLLRGSGAMAEKDIEFWRNNLSSAGSPRQLQSQLNLLADDLMGARIGSIKQSYEMNMRKKAPDFVSPEAKEALNAIKGRLPGQNAAPAATPAASPAGDPLAQARAAIAAGAPRAAVIERLQKNGIDPAGL